MIEPEVAFIDIADNMDLAEDFIKYCISYALERCHDDIEFLSQMYDQELEARLRSIVDSTFVRLTYTEGVKILQEFPAASSSSRIVGHRPPERA